MATMTALLAPRDPVGEIEGGRYVNARRHCSNTHTHHEEGKTKPRTNSNKKKNKRTKTKPRVVPLWVLGVAAQSMFVKHSAQRGRAFLHDGQDRMRKEVSLVVSALGEEAAASVAGGASVGGACFLLASDLTLNVDLNLL